MCHNDTKIIDESVFFMKFVKKKIMVLPVEQFQPGLSVDCVIFGFHEDELKILLMKLKNLEKWTLPGGFVDRAKDIEQQAAFVLKQRTGLDHIFLQQFHIFGDLARNDSEHVRQLVEKQIIPVEWRSWFEQRFVTVGYYALVEYSKVQKPTPDDISERCEWCSIKAIPELILDHRKIIDRAHQTLKKELNTQPIGLNLLPEYFTMPELQALYETVLEKKLDRRNFSRKMLSYDILITTSERRTGSPHKAPRLYKFDLDKYRQAMEAGLRSGW